MEGRPVDHPENVARGRGTSVNPGNRFDGLRLEVLDEVRAEAARDTPAGVQVPTRVYADSTRRIINRVDSPDLSFGWTINPYRGCECGCCYCLDGATMILKADGSWCPSRRTRSAATTRWSR